MSNKYWWLTEEEQEFLEKGDLNYCFPSLKTTLKERQFKISDLGIAPRDATYWDKQKILPPIGQTGVRKYNLVESIWIRLITQMRSMGISLQVIKRFHKNLFSADSNVSVSEALQMDGVQEIIRQMAREKGNLDEVEEFLNSAEMIKEMANESISMFELMVLQAIVFKKPISFLVDDEGYFMPYSFHTHLKLHKEVPEIADILATPHFSISVSQAYGDLLKSWEIKPFFDSISILSNEEMKIVEELRKSGLKSVKIKFRDGEMDLMETTTEEKASITSRFFDAISKNGYHNITIKSKNGKIVHFENTMLKKLKSIG